MTKAKAACTVALVAALLLLYAVAGGFDREGEQRAAATPTKEAR
jgi:hypothetical protein